MYSGIKYSKNVISVPVFDVSVNTVTRENEENACRKLAFRCEQASITHLHARQ